MCIPGDEWLGAILTEPHIFMEKIPLFFQCCADTGKAKAWKKRFFVPIQNSIETAIVFSIGVCSSKHAAESYFIDPKWQNKLALCKSDWQ